MNNNENLITMKICKAKAHKKHKKKILTSILVNEDLTINLESDYVNIALCSE